VITFFICYSLLITLTACITLGILLVRTKDVDWKKSFNTLDKEYEKLKNKIGLKDSLIKTLEERNKVLLETNANQREEVRIYRDVLKQIAQLASEHTNNDARFRCVKNKSQVEEIYHLINVANENKRGCECGFLLEPHSEFLDIVDLNKVCNRCKQIFNLEKG
jgi:hypothetical protein